MCDLSFWKDGITITGMERAVGGAALGEDEELSFGHIKIEMLLDFPVEMTRGSWISKLTVRGKCRLGMSFWK